MTPHNHLPTHNMQNQRQTVRSLYHTAWSKCNPRTRVQSDDGLRLPATVRYHVSQYAFPECRPGATDLQSPGRFCRKSGPGSDHAIVTEVLRESDNARGSHQRGEMPARHEIRFGCGRGRRKASGRASVPASRKVRTVPTIAYGDETCSKERKQAVIRTFIPGN